MHLAVLGETGLAVRRIGSDHPLAGHACPTARPGLVSVWCDGYRSSSRGRPTPHVEEPEGRHARHAHPPRRPRSGLPSPRHAALRAHRCGLLGDHHRRLLRGAHRPRVRPPRVVRLGADIALIGAVFAWQIRRISVAELPELRAIEALGIVVVLFLVVFSGIYLGMSHERRSHSPSTTSTRRRRSTSPSPSSRPSASVTSRRRPTPPDWWSRPRCCSTSPSSAPSSASSSTRPKAASRRPRSRRPGGRPSSRTSPPWPSPWPALTYRRRPSLRSPSM